MNTIKIGSRGEDVKKLQQILGINADGVFGPATEIKVKAWQKSKGLVADGIVGPKSWELLLKTNEQPNTSTISIMIQDI